MFDHNYSTIIRNVCSAKKLTKCSSNTIMCLVSFSAEQTLCMYKSILCTYYEKLTLKNVEKPLLCYDIGPLFFFSRNKVGMKRVH